MPDFDYDAYQKELSVQKQQWAEEFSAANKEEEQRWYNYMPIYALVMLMCFVFFLFFPFETVLTESTPFQLCYIFSYINLFATIQIFQFVRKKKKVKFASVQLNASQDEILPAATQMQPHVYAYSMVTIICAFSILFIDIFALVSDLLTRFGAAISHSLAFVGIVLSMYLMKYCWKTTKKKNRK